MRLLSSEVFYLLGGAGLVHGVGVKAIVGLRSQVGDGQFRLFGHEADRGVGEKSGTYQLEYVAIGEIGRGPAECGRSLSQFRGEEYKSRRSFSRSFLSGEHLGCKMAAPNRARASAVVYPNPPG